MWYNRTMIKKEYLIILTLLLFAFISCSNNQSSIITYETENTLKSQIKTKGDDILWTKELEGSLLIEDIKKNPVVLNNTLSPYIMNIISNQYEEVYPEYKSFGSLDTRNISSELKTFINSFCDHLSKNIYSSPDNYISSDFKFSYIFFVKELEDGWKKYFNLDFPFDPNEESEKEEKSAAENIEENNVYKAEKKLFNSYVPGQPFISDNYIQIPVRFFSSSGYFDAIIYINNTEPYYIYNIEIAGWENKNAK